MYDIGIIGAGPGGYVAALYAAIKGLNVVLFEKQKVGGTCLNTGCIPTKSLLASAELYKKIVKATDFGINVENVNPDFNKIFDQKDDIVKNLRNGIEFLIKKRKITYIEKLATLVDENTIKTDTDEYKVKNTIISTGSTPLDIPAFKRDGDYILNSTDALELKEIPNEIVIIGGGVIGVEFASFWSSFGKKVTIVELADTILPFCDKELVKKFSLSLKKNKIKLITGAKVEKTEIIDDKVQVTLGSGKVISCDKVLCAIGRKVNTENINLSLEFDGNMIKVDNQMQTSVSGVYAIGDVASKVQLAHVASTQALVAVNNIIGEESYFSYRAIPYCIYGMPEVAWCGLTEEEARIDGEDIKVGQFKFSALGKAMAVREKDGFIKVISDSNDNVLGVHIMGPKATELISEANTALASRLKIYEWGGIIHAHPTLSEGLMEALHDVHGNSVHNI